MSVYPRAKLRLCAWHLISLPFKKLGRHASMNMAKKEKLGAARNAAWRLTCSETAEESCHAFDEMSTQLRLSAVDDDAVTSIVTSIQANSPRLAGHFFTDRITLGVTTTTWRESHILAVFML